MRRPFALAVALLLSLPAIAAQIRPAPQGVYKVEVTEIPVDLIVLDSKGRPILDLKREDFEIWEEGVRQPIINFSIESFSENVVAPDAAKSRLTAVTNAKPVGHRTILLLLGRGRLGWFDSIEQITEFVRHDLKPNDLVAVMAYNRASPFTTDHQETVRLLEQYKIQSKDIESALELRDQGVGYRYRSAMYSPALQARIDRIFSGAGVVAANPPPSPLKDRVKLESELGEALVADARLEMEKAHQELKKYKQEQSPSGGVQPEPPVPLAGDPLAEPEAELRLLTGDLPFEDYLKARVSTAHDVEHLFCAIEYLRFMPGEKHVIFANDQGLYLSRRQYEKGLTSVASDARVRLHSLQTGGMYRGPSGYDVDQRLARGVVRGRDVPVLMQRGEIQKSGMVSNITSIALAGEVANLTGGLSFVRKDVGQALDTINAATNSVYLLTYRPGEGKKDGSFRKIEVKVKRNRAHAYHRSGYYAVEEPKPYDREAFMTYARTGAALQSEDLNGEIPISCTVETAKDADKNSYVATIRLRVKPDADVFKPQGNRRVGKLAVSYFLASTEGQIVEESWDSVDLNPSEASYQTMLAQGLQLKKEFTCKGEAKYFLKIIVYDPKTDRIASEVKDVKKP